jgi:hypothetical protein
MKIFLFVLFLTFLSMAQLKCIINNFDSYISNHIEATKGVLDGYPHWRIYQNRVIGPYTIALTQKVTGLNFERSYLLMTFVWLFLFYSTLTVVSFSLNFSILSTLTTALTAGFFNTVLMQGVWLYPWDLIDLTIFTIYTWLIIKKKSINYFSLVTIFETFNREVSLLVAGWLLFDSLISIQPISKKFPKINIHINRNQLIISILLIFFVGFTVEVLRNFLLIQETGPLIFHDTNGPGGHFMIHIWSNIKFIYDSLLNMRPTITYCLLIFGLLILCINGMRSTNIVIVKISMLYLILWVSTFTFGLIHEIRVWISFVPFIAIVCPMILNSNEKNIYRL